MTKKKHPLWFEEPVEDMIRGLWREPWLNRLSDIKFPEKFKAFTKFISIQLGETDDELFLRAELPGFKKDEIKLKVTPKAVYISAEKKKQAIEKDKTFFRMEKDFSSASRVMSLPEEVKTEGVKAKFDDGILEIVLKKKETTKEKEVKIE